MGEALRELVPNDKRMYLLQVEVGIPIHPRLVQRFVHDTEVPIPPFLRLCEGSIDLLDASSQGQGCAGFSGCPHGQGKVLVRELGDEASPISPVGRRARVPDLDFGNWVVDLAGLSLASHLLKSRETAPSRTSLDQHLPVELLIMSART